MGIIVMQLVCDTCGKVLLEKHGVSEEKFPITNEEAQKSKRNSRLQVDFSALQNGSIWNPFGFTFFHY
jgi:hypothetical protein